MTSTEQRKNLQCEAANAGNLGGEFFTHQSVSKLIAQLAIHKQETINKINDPSAGSGSLLQAKKHFDKHIIEEGFFGQEINHTSDNLSVSSYVEVKDTREKVDITELNAQIKTTVERIDTLRVSIDAIVAEIEA